MTTNSGVILTGILLSCILTPSHQGSILDGLRGHLSFTLGGGGAGHGGHGGVRWSGPKLLALPNFLTGGRGGHVGGLLKSISIPSLTLKHPGHHPVHHHHSVPLVHPPPHPHLAASHHAPVVAHHLPIHKHHGHAVITHHVHKPILVAPPIIAPPTIVHAKPVRANLVYVPLAVLNGLAPPGSIFVHHDDADGYGYGGGGWSGSGAVAKIPLLGEKQLVIPVKTITGFGGGVGLGHAADFVGHAHIEFAAHHHEPEHADHSEVIEHVHEAKTVVEEHEHEHHEAVE